MWIGSCYDAEQSVDPKKCQSNEVCGYLFKGHVRRIPLVAEDVGNNYGRTIEFDPATGELMIRTIGVGDTVI